jgi:hypothetical protein
MGDFQGHPFRGNQWTTAASVQSDLDQARKDFGMEPAPAVSPRALARIVKSDTKSYTVIVRPVDDGAGRFGVNVSSVAKRLDRTVGRLTSAGSSNKTVWTRDELLKELKARTERSDYFVSDWEKNPPKAAR